MTDTTVDKPERAPSRARKFTGVKLHPDDRGPETGEVGLTRIEQYAMEAGRDFSAQVRHMLTEQARVIERGKAKAARAAAKADAPQE